MTACKVGGELKAAIKLLPLIAAGIEHAACYDCPALPGVGYEAHVPRPVSRNGLVELLEADERKRETAVRVLNWSGAPAAPDLTSILTVLHAALEANGINPENVAGPLDLEAVARTAQAAIRKRREHAGPAARMPAN